MKKHTPESLQALRKGVLDFLANDGFRPSINSDGEIMFHFEGKICYLQTTADDSEYMRIIIVNFRPVADEADLARVTAAAHDATAGTKVVKIFTLDGDTWCVAEFLLPEPSRFTDVFPRTLSAMRAALRTFEKSLAAKN
jgi:hypothetical protein